jgi:hypothetical protein
VPGPYVVDTLGALGHVDPSTWTYTGLNAGTGTRSIAISATGTEAWLYCFLVQGCLSPVMKVYNFATNTVTPVVPLTTADWFPSLSTVPSAQLRRAYIGFNAQNSQIRVFQTDPPAFLGYTQVPVQAHWTVVD